MYGTLKLKHNGEEIKICTTKRAGQWRYVYAHTENSHKHTLLDRSQLYTTESLRESASEVMFESPCDTPNQMCCSLLQVQTVKCVSRPIYARRGEVAFENAYVRAKYNAYFIVCCICDDCAYEQNILKQDLVIRLDASRLRDYTRLICSHTVDASGKIVQNPYSHYIYETVKDDLTQQGITEEQAIIQYAKEHDGFTHEDFLKAGFCFTVPPIHILPDLSDGVYDPTRIDHVYNRYVDDYAYLSTCVSIIRNIEYEVQHPRDNAQNENVTESQFREDFSTLICPYMPYQQAFESAALLLREHKDILDTSEVGKLNFNMLLSGIRSYSGILIVHSVRLETFEEGNNFVGQSITQSELRQLHLEAEKDKGKISRSCVQIVRDVINSRMKEMRVFCLMNMRDYELTGEELMSNLFSKYIWIADIAKLWESTNEICTLDDSYKKYMKNARRLAENAITEWCQTLLDREGVILRPSESGESLDGAVCEECIAYKQKDRADCYLTCTIVYFSTKNLCVLKRYLERLRDICADMNIIGVHARNMFSLRNNDVYNSETEAIHMSPQDRQTLRKDADDIWNSLYSVNVCDIHKYGYTDKTLYTEMLNSIKDRSYSFLYIHSNILDTLYIILTTNKILLSIDRNFKRVHYDHSTNRYIFSMGTIMLNTDSCDNECLYNMHTTNSNAIIVGSLSSSSSELNDTAQIVDNIGRKNAKRQCLICSYAKSLLSYMYHLKYEYAQDTHNTTERTVQKRNIQARNRKFINLKTLCAKFHCKYSPVYFEARFNDNDPIRLYDQRDDLNIWHVSAHSQHQYVYHKAHMFRVYIFGAFVNRLNKDADCYEQKRSHNRTRPVKTHIKGLRPGDQIDVNQCSKCSQGVVSVDHNSDMGTYISAHIAKVLPTIMSFYKFRSFNNTTPSELDDLIHNNLFPVQACDSTVELLYHEDTAILKNIGQYIRGEKISTEVSEQILKDERFYMIIMESENTVYGAASTSVQALQEDIDDCYYQKPAIYHDDRNIIVSNARHSKNDAKAFYAKYAYSFVGCRDEDVKKTIEQRKQSIACALQQQTRQHTQQDKSTEDTEQKIRETVYKRVLEVIDEQESEGEEKYSKTYEDKDTENIAHKDEEINGPTYTSQKDSSTTETNKSDTHKDNDTKNDSNTRNESLEKTQTGHTHKENTDKLNTTKTKLSLNTNTLCEYSVFDKCSGAKRFMKTHHSLISAGKLIGSRRKIDKPLRARRSLSRESRSAREGGYESDGYESCSEKSSTYRSRSVSKNRRRVKEEQSINTSETSQSLTVDDMIQAEINRRALYEEQQKRKETEKENARLQKSDSKTLQKYKKEQKKCKQKNKRK